MVSKKFPARLHVLLARDAEVGVVFRRGPTKYVAVFLWHRNTDTFELGQWFHGRIYERRSDLAPNGRFLLYFAMNGRWESETGGSWTVVSRTPWLKALALYQKGDCWEGGGLFLSDNEFWLNDRCYSDRSGTVESPEINRRSDYVPEAMYGAEDAGVYYLRLQRDGWKLVERTGPKLDSVSIFEKALPWGGILRKIAHEQIGAPPGKGCYWDEHEIVDSSGYVSPKPTWEWAGSMGHASFGLKKAGCSHCQMSAALFI